MILQQSRRFAFAKGRLADHYDLKKRKEALTALREKIKNAAWWKQMLGLDRKDRKLFREQARVYKGAVGQYREKIVQIEEQWRNSLAELKARQDKEAGDFELNIETQRAAACNAPIQEQRREQSRRGLRNNFADAQTVVSEENRNKTKERRLARPSRSH